MISKFFTPTIKKAYDEKSSKIRILDEQVVARISSIVVGIIHGIEAVTHLLLSTAQELVGGLLTRDLKQIGEAGKYLLIAVICAIALPMLGVAGIFMPKAACRMAKRMDNFIETYLKASSKEEYGCYSIRAMSLIKAVTIGSQGFVRSLAALILWPLHDRELLSVSLQNVILGPILFPLAGIQGVFTTPDATLRLKLKT